MMNSSETSLETWYVVKQSSGQCEILSELPAEGDSTSRTVEKWGPFTSEGEAIARRVGLIRAGKCQPA